MFNPKPVHIDVNRSLQYMKSFLSFYWSKKRLNILLVLGCMVFGGVAAFLQKPAYRAICSFVLEEKSGSASSLSNIASQFGVDLGALSGGSNSLFSGDNIIDIMTSESIINEVLLTEYDSTNLMANTYIESVGLRKKFGWTNILKKISFTTGEDVGRKNLLKDSILHELALMIQKKQLAVERINKKGTMFKVQVESKDRYFAEIFTKRLVEKTILLYTGIKTKNITANIEKLESRADSLRALVNAKAFQSYSSAVLNANEVYKNSKTNIEINQRDKMVAFEIYTEVVKNLEASKMSLMNETPIIQIIDKPEQPLKNIHLNGLVLWLLISILGVGMTFVIAYILYNPENSTAP